MMFWGGGVFFSSLSSSSNICHTFIYPQTKQIFKDFGLVAKVKLNQDLKVSPLSRGGRLGGGIKFRNDHFDRNVTWSLFRCLVIPLWVPLPFFPGGIWYSKLDDVYNVTLKYQKLPRNREERSKTCNLVRDRLR